MDRKAPELFIEGMEVIIKRDLEKHKVLLIRSNQELLSYRNARSHEVKRKKYYKSLIGGEKYNDDSLRRSMNDIVINIRHFSDKVKLSEDAIKHHTLIVDTLSKQLDDQNKGLDALAKYRRDHQNAANN